MSIINQPVLEHEGKAFESGTYFSTAAKNCCNRLYSVNVRHGTVSIIENDIQLWSKNGNVC